MGIIVIVASAVLLLAAGVMITREHRREVAVLERKLDRVLRRLGLDPETGELVE